MKTNMFRRLQSLLPRWFGDQTPILDAVLRGLALTADFIHRLIGYARLQTRIKTATDGWLDIIAADFFGNMLKRGASQSDSTFSSRIIANLFRERATRRGLIQTLTDLSGQAPIVFEPQRPLDTGSYRGPRLGYGAAGGYGSMHLAYQCFVTAYRPRIANAPFIAGYRISTGAYSTPSRAAYAQRGGMRDTDIFEAIDRVKPVGTTVWMRFAH
jgi:hypothetical protein